MSAALPAEAAPWSFAPPRDITPLREEDHGWCRGDLDRWVFASAAAHGLVPSGPADPATLLRRVSLDLTGLPPTPTETAAFLAHPTEAAYAEAVERLLASPRFGERWATVWLDAARYADTQGYEKDNLRTTWAYRDWVVQAFNDDLPFDRFTIEQLAGDLLPNATVDDLTATAFHRQTMTNTEGGTDDEEFRLKAVMDRASTTATVWMGMTLACAQCHDHPSEPLTPRDYFGFLAFFNNTADSDRDDDQPILSLLPISERGLPPAETPRETTVPILRELPAAEARTTRIWRKGDWRQPGEAVEPGVPAGLPPLPAGPRDRLALARWLVSSDHPLTARVAVNRLWAQIFGRGLVATEEDFGASGAAPSHPDLLDWLARRFAGSLGWSTKALLREIVLTATYRQSSATTPAAFARDPENRWLARGARFPLWAEAVRDQALAAAGLLSPKIGGRSVMPPQPEGVWQVVYNVQRWVTSRGEDRYRRGLYTFWRRTSPYPGLAILGAPSREACTVRRQRVPSPAQALVTLNDPVFTEAAAALAQRMNTEGGATLDDRLRYGWRLLLAVTPTETSLQALRELAGKIGQGTEIPSEVGAALLNLDATLTHE